MTQHPPPGGRGRFVVLSSPSGGGKSTVTKRLLAANPRFTYSVSVTTRPPRSHEKQGQAYWFVDREEFLRRRDRGDLLEWEEVYGEYYGTPRQPAEEAIAAGFVVLFDLDVKGALKFKQLHPDAILIFLSPPSYEILEQRLRARGTESEDRLKRRLSLAKWECDQSKRFDHTVINLDLEQTIREVADFIDHHLT
jgi:guanylate kinase